MILRLLGNIRRFRGYTNIADAAKVPKTVLYNFFDDYCRIPRLSGVNINEAN